MDVVQIIAKKIKGPLSEAEQRHLEQWLAESNENRSLFQRLQALEHKEIDISHIAGLKEEALWNDILERSKVKQKNRRAQLRPLFKYAAIFIGIIGLGYGYWKYHTPVQQDSLGTDDPITLQLGNGEVRVISPESLQTIINEKGSVLSKQKGNQLDYSDSEGTEELSYNVLTVPYGKRFSIILSDSTAVHLNAGSSLKYPVKFTAGQNRQVFLTGEGYFEVYKNEEHPFVVTSSTMDVRVLGTKFNISAYPEDPQINTVLVEGSVSLYASESSYTKKTAGVLEPGYKAAWNRFDEKIVYEQVDTDIYTGWIDGKLVVKEMPFKNIVQKLERYYKVSIDNTYKRLDDEIFTATFDIETIEEALKIFAEETPFDYSFDGDHITIYESKTEYLKK